MLNLAARHRFKFRKKATLVTARWTAAIGALRSAAAALSVCGLVKGRNTRQHTSLYNTSFITDYTSNLHSKFLSF